MLSLRFEKLRARQILKTEPTILSKRETTEGKEKKKKKGKKDVISYF